MRITISKAKYTILISLFGFLFFSNFALAANAGEKINFSVDSYYDSSKRASVNSTLKWIGQKAYFYVEDDWWNGLTVSQQTTALNSILNLSNEFDQRIYPILISVYGSEWNPGIDGDSKITILVTKMVAEAGGYFNYLDENPKSRFLNSNEREMIYLNSTYINDSRNSAFLAHELQHLITYYQKNIRFNLDEEIWLNEARSEYASTLLGYDNSYQGSNLEKRVNVFLANPTDPLAEWRNETKDYGVTNLFIQYLVDHYGTRILTLMTQSSLTGISSIESSLQVMGATERFVDIFTNWAIANYLNNCGLGSLRTYCYINLNLSSSILRVSPTSVYSIAGNALELASWTKDWSPRWYKIVPADSQTRMLQVNFEGYGSLSNFRVVYILKENNVDKMYFMTINADQTGTLLIPNFGSVIQSITLIPVNTYKKEGFSSNESNTPFSFKLSTEVNQSNNFPDGALVKLFIEPKVYLIDDGVKRWIPSAEIFEARGYKWENIKIVPYEELVSYPEAGVVSWPEGSLLKSANYPTVYIISLEKKRPLASAEVFSGLGYRWENIKVISQQELDQYETSMPVYGLPHPDGSLIKFSDSPNIYLIDGGKKRLIPSAEVFLGKGYRFEMVVNVDVSLRNAYVDGQQVL